MIHPDLQLHLAALLGTALLQNFCVHIKDIGGADEDHPLVAFAGDSVRYWRW